VISTARLNRIMEIDVRASTARVEAGVSLDQLMRASVPLGLWPAVTPGTRQVTVGGAIASDIHGKNHHCDGAFCTHVDSLVIATPGRGIITASARTEPDVFWATAGGMGLTGVILEATLRLTRVESSYIRVDSERCRDLDCLMARMVDADGTYRYSVAWVDCLARGSSLGRSILELGDHARLDELPADRRDPASALSFDPRPRLTAPRWTPGGLLNRLSMSAFNELWYRKAPRRPERHLAGLASYFHPLDAVTDWNRMYGPRGFLQYQFVVPDGAESVVRSAIESLASHRCAGFLAVLKRFGPADPGPLSFARPGWTLAVDLPAGGAGMGPTGLGRLLDRLDEQVAEAGGRIYLSKDSRLRPELLPIMYPELPQWQAVRESLDPERCLRSDLCRRVWTLYGADRAHQGEPVSADVGAGR
jgi:decaprenylphospho-beta-D-ribofuranose 2-oxidase